MATQSLCLEMVLLSIPAILSEGTIASTSFQSFAVLLEELLASDVLVCIGSHWIAKLQACSGVQRDLAYQVLSLLEDRVEILEVPEALATAFRHLPLTKSIDVAIAQENGIDLQVVWQHHGAIDLEDLTITDMSSDGASLISAHQFMQSYLKFQPESSQEAIDGGLSELRAWLNPFVPSGGGLVADARSLQANLTYHNLIRQAQGDYTSDQPLFTLGLSFFLLEVRTLESFTPRDFTVYSQNPSVTVLEINTQAIASAIVSNTQTLQISIHETDAIPTSVDQPSYFIKPFVATSYPIASLRDTENPTSGNTSNIALESKSLESKSLESKSISGVEDASQVASAGSIQFADSSQNVAFPPEPILVPPTFALPIAPPLSFRETIASDPNPVSTLPSPIFPVLKPSVPLPPSLPEMIPSLSVSDLGSENIFILRSGAGMLQISSLTPFNSESRFGLIAGISFEDLEITYHAAPDPSKSFTEIRLAQTEDVLAQISTLVPIDRELFVTVVEPGQSAFASNDANNDSQSFHPFPSSNLDFPVPEPIDCGSTQFPPAIALSRSPEPTAISNNPLPLGFTSATASPTLFPG
jgi:hypothetical protein